MVANPISLLRKRIASNQRKTAATAFRASRLESRDAMRTLVNSSTARRKKLLSGETASTKQVALANAFLVDKSKMRDENFARLMDARRAEKLIPSRTRKLVFGLKRGQQVFAVSNSGKNYAGRFVRFEKDFNRAILLDKENNPFYLKLDKIKSLQLKTNPLKLSE